jgi:hypothetical protein
MRHEFVEACNLQQDPHAITTVNPAEVSKSHTLRRRRTNVGVLSIKRRCLRLLLSRELYPHTSNALRYLS